MIKIEEHKQKMGIGSDHILHLISSEIKSINGNDTDKIRYREENQNGEFVAFYIVEDGISKYPPFKKVFHFEKE